MIDPDNKPLTEEDFKHMPRRIKRKGLKAKYWACPNCKLPLVHKHWIGDGFKYGCDCGWKPRY